MVVDSSQASRSLPLAPAPLVGPSGPPALDPSQSSSSAAAIRHAWTKILDRDQWVCRLCLRASSDVFPPNTLCQGANRVISSLVRNSRGHTLYLSRPNSVELLVICGQCGYYTTGGQCRGLARPCGDSFPTSKCRTNWNRVSQLRHPDFKWGSAKVLEPLILVESLFQA